MTKIKLFLCVFVSEISLSTLSSLISQNVLILLIMLVTWYPQPEASLMYILHDPCITLHLGKSAFAKKQSFTCPKLPSILAMNLR